MFRPSVLLLALLLSSRAWWSAVSGPNGSLLGALVWFLVAVPVAGLALGGLRILTAGYRQRPANPRPPGTTHPEV